MLTITEVSRTHDVSARMLRYYEQQGLLAWGENNKHYILAGSGTPENMFGGLEEHLNWVLCAQEGAQLPIRVDLLLPIRKRSE